MIQIITDSTSGISQEEAKSLGITVLPVNIDFDNEIFYDGINLSFEEFYAKLANSTNALATLPPNALEYVERFESAKANAESLLVITLSSQLSVVFNSANMCKTEVDFPQIEIIDSLTTGYGLRLMVLEAIKYRETKTLLELADHLNKFKSHIHTLATVDNLDALISSGRIQNINNLPKCVLNIKPIISLTNGSITYLDKKVGTKNAQDYIIGELKNSTLSSDYSIAIQYVHDEQKTDYLREKLQQLFSTKTVEVSRIPYLLGAYLSDNATVVTFVTK